MKKKPKKVVYDRSPRKGELNFDLEALVKRSFKRSHSNVLVTIAHVQEGLSRVCKKWNIIDARVDYDCQYVPDMRDVFVEAIEIHAYRKRLNRTIADHKVVMTFWPNASDSLKAEFIERNETNPMILSCINDPWILLSVRKDSIDSKRRTAKIM